MSLSYSQYDVGSDLHSGRQPHKVGTATWEPASGINGVVLRWSSLPGVGGNCRQAVRDGSTPRS